MQPFEKRLIARILVSLWAIFWVYFAFASSVPGAKNIWWVVIPTLIALLLCGGSALVAWTKEKIGSALLVAVSLGLTAWVFSMPHTLLNRLFVVGYAHPAPAGSWPAAVEPAFSPRPFADRIGQRRVLTGSVCRATTFPRLLRTSSVRV